MKKRGLRSFSFSPADRIKMVEKSLQLQCDAIIYDLEDSVSADHKELARQVLRELKKNTDLSGVCYFIRINSMDSPYYKADRELAAELVPTGVVLPKATPESLTDLSAFFDKVEDNNGLERGSILINPICETAFAMEHLKEIFSSSMRIQYAMFGGEDLTRDLGIKRTQVGEELMYGRWRFVYACVAFGIIPVDTVYINIHDLDGLLAEIETVKNMGFRAKACIHPSHIAAINEGFLPSEEELAWAKKVLDASALPQYSSLGSFSLDGEMIDIPVIHRAQDFIARADLAR